MLPAIAVLLGVGSGVAQASPGANPVNCPGAYTMGSAQFNVRGAIVTVELRRSAACEAGWGRITSTGNGPIGITFSAWNPGQGSQYQVSGTNWTYEVNGNPGQQVCAGFQAWNNATGQYIGWYFAGCATV